MKYKKLETKKIEMSQRFLPEGVVIPVTKLSVLSDFSELEIGMSVAVSGITRGKGFSGVVKRWGFAGGPATHGSGWSRKTGSIGAGTTPGRVHKGKKMPGRMGNEKKTVKGLKIVWLDAENNIVEVKGAVPGHRNSKITLLLEKAND